MQYICITLTEALYYKPWFTTQISVFALDLVNVSLASTIYQNLVLIKHSFVLVERSVAFTYACNMGFSVRLGFVST